MKMRYRGRNFLLGGEIPYTCIMRVCAYMYCDLSLVGGRRFSVCRGFWRGGWGIAGRGISLHMHFLRSFKTSVLLSDRLAYCPAYLTWIVSKMPEFTRFCPSVIRRIYRVFSRSGDARLPVRACDLCVIYAWIYRLGRLGSVGLGEGESDA